MNLTYKKKAKYLMNIHETIDPFIIATYEKIEVIYLEFKSVLGMFSIINGKKVIFINSNLPEFAKRIVCAHELGHAQQDFTDAVFMKENWLFGESTIENEANQFCATIIFEQDFENTELTKFDIELLNKLEKFYIKD